MGFTLFFVKLVYQQPKIVRDQTFEGVPDSGCTRDSRAHIWSIFGSILPNHLNMLKTMLWCALLVATSLLNTYTGWPRKHYPSLSQVAEILLIMTQIGHFATRFLTKSKEMGTIWTSRFEDKSLNFIARYF